MRKCRSIIILLILIITLSFSFSSAQSSEAKDLKCINGENAKGTAWVQSFSNDNDSELKKAYREFVKKREEEKTKLANAHTNIPQNCNDLTNSPLKKVIHMTFKVISNFFPQILLWESLTYYWEYTQSEKQRRELGQNTRLFLNEKRPKSSIINRICILEAMKIETGGKSVYCNSANDNPSSGKKRNGPQNKGRNIKECIDDSLVDYISFSVNSAIQCFSESVDTNFGPIDSKLIFEKLTNESAFNYTLADPAKGISIGQLTTPAIEDLSEKNRGNYILPQISNSNSTHCNGFKKVAKDIPSGGLYTHNVCKWVSPGDGLARSLIYSIGFYLTLRDNYVVPQLRKFRSFDFKDSQWAEVIKSATTAAYGREGNNFVKKVLSRLAPNSTPSAINKALQKSAYVNEVRSKKMDLYSKIESAANQSDGQSEQPTGESLCFLNYPNP